MSKTLKDYRAKIQNMDRAQMLTEFNHVLDQLEQQRAGERAEVDWPWDGLARRKGYEQSVGPANEPKDEPRDHTYYSDGSVKSFRLDSGTVKRSSPSNG